MKPEESKLVAELGVYQINVVFKIYWYDYVYKLQDEQLQGVRFRFSDSI